MPPKRQFMLLTKIRTDGGTQARATIRPEVVDEYAEAVSGGAEMPPADVFEDEAGNVWMGDGFHRHAGYRQAGKTSMPVNVRKGSLRDAQLYAAGANDSHGLRRTAEDKRAAVQMLLKDADWCQASDRWIAEQCRVSDKTVAKIRQSINGQSGGQDVSGAEIRTSSNGESENPPKPKKRKGRDGKSYGGKKKPAGPKACETCKRKGAPTCEACRKAFPNGFPRKNGQEEIKDATGAVVPPHLRDAFADTQLAEMVATLEGLQAQFHPEPWVEKAGKLCDTYGFILIEKFRGYVYDSYARLQQATEALQSGLPHAVCPKCGGEDSNKDGKCCRGCRGFGHVPEHRYQELTRA